MPTVVAAIPLDARLPRSTRPTTSGALAPDLRSAIILSDRRRRTVAGKTTNRAVDGRRCPQDIVDRRPQATRRRRRRHAGRRRRPVSGPTVLQQAVQSGGTTVLTPADKTEFDACRGPRIAGGRLLLVGPEVGRILVVIVAARQVTR